VLGPSKEEDDVGGGHRWRVRKFKEVCRRGGRAFIFFKRKVSRTRGGGFGGKRFETFFEVELSVLLTKWFLFGGDY